MPSVNPTVIARVAAGLYDLQLGNASMTWALNSVDSVTYGGDLGALVQQLYNDDFKAAGNAALAATIVKNVGITGDAAAVAYVTNVLNANAGNEGAAIVAMLNGYSGIATGPYASTAAGFNTQINAASRYAQAPGSIDAPVHVPASLEGKNFTLTALQVAVPGSTSKLDVMNLHGDQDVRIDFSNPANQIVGLDLDGDGVIEFNGKERSITGKAANFEIVDAYSRNPLDHTDIVNNFLGDIYFDGSSAIDKDGDGTKSDGNIFLGGLGIDVALGGVGNDFLAGGGIAQSRIEDLDEDEDLDGDGDGDELYGGRNADFFFAEFSMLDLVDGNGRDVLYIDGGSTSDDSPAGTVQTDQDNDWLLLEGSDDDEPLLVVLTEGDGDGTDQDDANEVQSRTGQYMDIEDVENLDASGNLYGFLNGMTDSDGNQLRVGARSYDSRYDDGANKGAVNYGMGSSAQLNITGTDVANIIIAGYDNDFVAAGAGNDLLFGGNLQFLFETVAGSATNLNLANITLDGLDNLQGGAGNDGIVFEADGGTTNGDAGTDTLWVTNKALGTNTLASSVQDNRLRFDLGAQTDSATDDDGTGEPGFAGYGGANVGGTADQTNYISGAKTTRNTATAFEIVDASGLSTGVRGLDYFSAGTNAATDQSFSNRQNFTGYNDNLDLRGALNVDNQLYAGAGEDVIEARGGLAAALESATAYDNSMQGGLGNDDFYFAIDGDAGGDESNIIRRKIDANNDGFWDGSNAAGTPGTWGGDFGEIDSDPGDSVLLIDINKIVGTTTQDVELNEAVNFVSEIVTGVQNADGTFTAITLNSAAIRSATTYADLATAINNELALEYPGEAGKVVAKADGFSLVITDTQSRTLADTVSQVPGAGVTVNQKANTATENIFEFGQLAADVSQDRLIFKSYEDRSDNEGVDDDAITGSRVSLGTDAYAEDLVVSFAADGTRIAEDQEYNVVFRNLTTEDTVTINVNDVTYTLKVGVAVNGTQLDSEDTPETALDDIQSNFLKRMAGYIDSFMDDDSAAGQVDAAAIGLDNGDGDFTDNLAAGWTLSEVTSGIDLNADGDRADAAITSVTEAALGVDLNGDNDTLDTFTNATALNERAFGIQLSQVSYHDGEETVFMTVSAPTPVNGSGGEAASVRLIDNDAQTEVYLQAFDGRDNKLNATNVLFWGQEAISRSILETAKNAATASGTGDTITGSEAMVIDGGTGAGDDDLTNIPHNKATDRDFLDVAEDDADDGGVAYGWTDEAVDDLAAPQVENFAVHGDDYLIGGTGDDTIEGMTGDDRVRGSLGNDKVDGGKDYYAVREDGERTYDVEYLNAYEAHQRDGEGDVLDIQLILQTEDGVGLLAPRNDSPEEKYEAYFDDTLIYHQDDFTKGVTRFTVTLNDYDGTGEDIVFNNGGAGEVGVDSNGDDVIELENVSTFKNFENIRTVSGIGSADAGIGGKGGQQGRDTLNVNALSDDADVGVRYYLTGNDTDEAGDVQLLEDADFVDVDNDDEDDFVIDAIRVMIKVDGVENVVFGDGDDQLVIDETESAKDNVITGDLGTDSVYYTSDFANEEHQGDDEPTVTVRVGSRHSDAEDAGVDVVEMTEGRLGEVLAKDTLRGVEELFIYGNTAGGIREDDEINVENLSGGAVVNYVTGEILSDTDGDLDFDDGDLQLTIVGMEEFEVVRADGKDAVVVASAESLSANLRSDELGGPSGSDGEAPDVSIEPGLAVEDPDDGDDLPDAVDPQDLTINSFLNYDLLDFRNIEEVAGKPERLTVAELRALDDGTEDTADFGDLPEGYNFAQFKFFLGEDTDTVDYSQATDSIAAVLNVTSKTDTQYILVDRDDAPDSLFDALDDEAGDRVDQLVDVERIVASLSESILDFTGSEQDVKIEFEFDTDAIGLPDDGDIITTTVRIADGKGNQLENISQMVERYTFNDPFGDDGVLTDDDANWNRIEGSDANEEVTYQGSEDLPEQAGLDHRFTNDTLNLRGGMNNAVVYEPLETPIYATVLAMTPYDDSSIELGEDADDLGQIDTLHASGTLAVSVDFFDFDDPEVQAATGTHLITSHTVDNEIAPGHLKLTGTQDEFDVVDFSLLDDSIFYFLNVSSGVFKVGLEGQAASMTLTGFEFIAESDTDDVYELDDLAEFLDDIALFDAAGDDRDTLRLLDLGEALDFSEDNGAAAGVISLEIINDEFNFDFDVLDISIADDEDNLVIEGDDAGVNDAYDSADGTDDAEDFDGDGVEELYGDGLADDADDLIVGDLGLVDTIEFFNGLWLTETTIEEGDDSFVLDTTGADFELLDEVGGDEYLDAILGGIAELNFSRVTSDITLEVLGTASMTLVGGAGDDTIEGGGGDDVIHGGAGDDTLDGGLAAEVWEIELTSALDNDASGDDVDFEINGTSVLTLTEGVEIPEGAGITTLANAIVAGLTADLGDINDLELFTAVGGVEPVIAKVERDGSIIRITFAPGIDVDDGADAVDITTTDAASPIASAFIATSDGSAGGSDTFVFNDIGDGADTVANFLTTDDMVMIAGALLNEVDDGGSQEEPGDEGDDNGAITWANTLGATTEGLFVEEGSSDVSVADLDNLAAVAALLDDLFGDDTDLDDDATAGERGDDLLIAVENEDGGSWGLYYFIDTDEDQNFDAGELTLLAVIAADDFAVGDIVTP